jgi:uncharacterized protein (DUF58 family)
MIVPAPRLLAAWALAGVPLAGLAGVAPAALPAVVAALTAVVAVAAADALAARRRAAKLGVRLPEVVRLVRGRPGELAVRASCGALPAPPALRLALAAAPEVGFDPPEIDLAWPAGAAAANVVWPATAHVRGRARLSEVAVEVRSPLGLWQARRRLEAACELRVYPDLGAEARRVAVRLWRRGALGQHVARQLGRGREFDRLRDYVSGDPLDEIHWKATAKRGRPVSKVFQIERTQEVYVVLDRSRLAGRRFGDEPALESFLRAALVVGGATRRFGDRFGLVAFSDRVERFVRAGSGRVHFNLCRDALFDGRSRPVAPDYAELAAFLRTRLRRRALLLVLTDLEDPAHAEAFQAAARVVAKRHLVLAFGLRAEGVEPLFGSPAASAAEVYRRLAGHRRWQKLEELRRSLARDGVGFHLAASEGLVGDVVSRYAEAKARQRI